MKKLNFEETKTEEKVVNYWCEIKNEMPNLFKNIKGIILLTHNSIEFVDIIEFLNKTRSNQFQTILYISLIRSHDYMKKALEQNPLENKRIFFIDCVSGYVFIEEDIEECMYHKPPQSLEETKKIINFGIKKINPDIVILDSLSHLINFSKITKEEINGFNNFLRKIKEEMKNSSKKTFILLYDTKMKMIKNLPNNFTDIVLKIEISENKKSLEKSYHFDF